MNTTTVGIDSAKSAFSLHGVDRRGKVVLQLKNARVDVFLIGA
jgi:hypothetical protein